MIGISNIKTYLSSSCNDTFQMRYYRSPQFKDVKCSIIGRLGYKQRLKAELSPGPPLIHVDCLFLHCQKTISICSQTPAILNPFARELVPLTSVGLMNKHAQNWCVTMKAQNIWSRWNSIGLWSQSHNCSSLSEIKQRVASCAKLLQFFPFL